MIKLSLLAILWLGFHMAYGANEPSHKYTMLLSLLRPNWDYRSGRGMELATPMCQVHKQYPYKRSVGVTMYGVTRPYTAVLTGYSTQQDRTKPRSNKGVLYGWNASVRPPYNGKMSFLFYSDFAMPKPVRGQSAEFCCHLYSPPLVAGPSVTAALGTAFSDPARNFESDEHMDLVLRRESNNGSRRVATCCFLTHG